MFKVIIGKQPNKRSFIVRVMVTLPRADLVRVDINCSSPIVIARHDWGACNIRNLIGKYDIIDSIDVCAHSYISALQVMTF